MRVRPHYCACITFHKNHSSRRDDPNGAYTTQQASEEFGLSEESIKLLLEIARRPILVVDKSVPDLLVAK